MHGPLSPRLAVPDRKLPLEGAKTAGNGKLKTRLGGIPLRFETAAVVFWAIVLAVLGVGSSLLSARRVLRIVPVEATTGGANR